MALINAVFYATGEYLFSRAFFLINSDICSVCNGNSSCVGCDGYPYSAVNFDACHVCGGNNSTCTGCDNVLYSNKTLDACNVCGGNGETCAAIAPASKSNGNTAIIAGVVAGVGGLAIIAAIVIFVIIKRKKSPPASEIAMTENYAPISTPPQTNYESMGRSSVEPVQKPQPVLPAIRYDIDYSELVFEAPLGEG